MEGRSSIIFLTHSISLFSGDNPSVALPKCRRGQITWLLADGSSAVLQTNQLTLAIERKIAVLEFQCKFCRPIAGVAGVGHNKSLNSVLHASIRKEKSHHAAACEAFVTFVCMGAS